MPFNPGVDGRPNSGSFLALAIRSLDAGHGVGDGREHVLGVSGPWARQDLQHGGLEVPALLLRIPWSKRRLGDDVQDGRDRRELAPVDCIEASSAPLRRFRWRRASHARPPPMRRRGRKCVLL